MRKRIITCFLPIWLIVASILPVCTNAAQRSNIIQDVRVNGEHLTVLCANAEETGEYALQLDSAELPISVGSVDLTRTPVTVFCLVDTSGSISSFKMKLIRDTLLEISASLGKDDSMILATVDDQLTIGETLLSAEEREAAIDDIKSSYKDTNLYYGIVKSLEQLSSDETYHACRCLVILSDGTDCQGNGYTEQEVMTAIQNSRLPLYTVALVENYNEREGAKTLGSFARSSYGGRHLSTVDEGGNKPIRADSSGTEFGRTIWETLIGTSVLEADMTGVAVDASKASIRLCVQYKVGNSVYEDSVDLASNVFSSVPAASETESDAKEATTESVPEKPHTDPEISPLWGAVTVVISAAMAIVLGIVLHKRRKKIPHTPEVTQEIVAKPEKEQTASEKVIVDPYPVEKYYHLYLTDIPHGLSKCHYKLPENHAVTFGRDQRSDGIVNCRDRKLSGTHFAIIAQNEKFYVRDEKSRNGTFLNGIPIAGKGWSRLQSGDKLRAGSYEYRIVIKTEKNK